MQPQSAQRFGSYHRLEPLRTQQRGGYTAWVSRAADDPAWEAFLAETPGAHYAQSSLWARMKALSGWRATRVIVARGAQIVAGAQLLIHPLPLVGALGYVPKGPLAPAGDPDLARLVLDALHGAARAARVRYLAIQPAATGYPFARLLGDQGFQPQPRLGTCGATLRLDLTQDHAAILAQMKKRTRANIRRAEATGVSVRAGDERDLDTFYRLLVTAAKRKGFPVYARGHYAALWRALAPHGRVALFLAELAGEAVAAQLAIPFGDTMYTHVSAWSGEHGRCKPNEALEWAAICWARAHGCRVYDFEGIDPGVARAILGGAARTAVPAPEPDTMVTTYKLGFGGSVTLLPEACDYIYNPLLRLGYSTLSPPLQRWRLLSRVRKAVSRLVQPPMSRRDGTDLGDG